MKESEFDQPVSKTLSDLLLDLGIIWSEASRQDLPGSTAFCAIRGHYVDDSRIVMYIGDRVGVCDDCARYWLLE